MTGIVDSIVYDHNFLVWYMNKLLKDNARIELQNKQFSDNSVYTYLQELFRNNNTQYKTSLLYEYNNKFNTVKC